MKYVLYKFVEAETALLAIAQDAQTPVHEVSLKAGEQPGREHTTAVGFGAPAAQPVPDEYWGELLQGRRR